MRPGRSSWLPYLILVPVIGTALFLGSGRDSGPPTAEQRSDRIAAEVRCPTCEGLSVAESEAPASQAIRQEIRRRVDAGQSDDEVRSFLVSRYGKNILLRPEATGIAGLVWALPVAAVVCAMAGLALAFRRWSSRRPAEHSLIDRLLVGEARSR